MSPAGHARARLVLVGLSGLSLVAACDPPSSVTEGAPPVTGTSPSPVSSGAPGPGGRVLLAYFSRAGENYYDGGRRTLEIGNTEVVAGMIRGTIGCDVYRIDGAEPYSDSYDETVARNVREQDDDARPRITAPLPALDGYDTVIIGSPIWNVRPPMIMTTFTEALDFTGRTVFPLVTYAVSRLGRTEEVYRDTCRGAEFGEALAIRGEEAIGGLATVQDWSSRIGLR
ncbi:flavodoxin [Catenuloplanes nepalensis]|uniref:Flavodoxin n=1 Tax=Catenuloplanes nepalensis TaxID=587533 RepID=A0ABT9MRV6_9ACTN|nr:flavodoxin [Catenuloplanes nepalensis]MDP9794157.1 flavodoxin [Catenuloplanes nepalensis]